MKQFWKKAGRPGFTLIEVLVTVAVIGVLVAVTVPAVTSQIGAADPSRVASDMTNLTGAIDAFTANVRTTEPGDIDDLVNTINAISSTGSGASSTGDLDINGVVYGATQSARWKGPYLERPVPDTLSTAQNAFPSAFSSFVLNGFVKCNSKGALTFGCNTGSPDYLVVQIAPLTSTQFETINNLIDAGEAAGSVSVTSTPTSWSSGKLRFDGTSTAYYFATPLLK